MLVSASQLQFPLKDFGATERRFFVLTDTRLETVVILGWYCCFNECRSHVVRVVGSRKKGVFGEGIVN